MTATATPIVVDGTDVIEPLALVTEAVRIITGLDNAAPREGQAALTGHIVTAMEGRLHLAGQAPTGSGKSFAILGAAFRAAILYDERTVVSTDSLSLMGQLEDKDIATMQRAAAAIAPDRPVEVAVLKGVSNYVDPQRTVATAQTLTAASHIHRISELEKELRNEKSLRGLDQFPGIDDPESLRELVLWALGQYLPGGLNDVGDRHSCPIEHTTLAWMTVAAPSSEADDGERYGVTSKAEAAKARAETADIIITNHSILAVQAAKQIPIIIGSGRIGPIDHLVVDEAHTLPGHVRAQGATKVSGRTIMSAAYLVQKAAAKGKNVQGWMNDAEGIASQLDQILGEWAARERTGVVRLGEHDQPLGALGNVLKQWTAAGARLLDASGTVNERLKAINAADRLDSINAAAAESMRHRTGWARWVERDDRDGSRHGGASVNVSPVGVAFLLRDNLYRAPDPDDPESFYNLSVTCVSATLPGSFTHEAGMAAQLTKYPSPFTDAYARSALFIPQATTPQDVAAITSDRYGKTKFDVAKHPAWAAQHIVDLVRANGGSALVLTAKADDGRMYAERLRRDLPNLTVYSQWDGKTASQITTMWREDTDSVLVGTKSLMTGVDAPGETCSLVIIDRVPRSPSNPIDDARVEEITARTGDKWAADRFVYATDAALLAQQAVGRLIRSSSDTGMVVNLDPRLLKVRGGQLAYPEQTRLIYMDALYPFGQKMSQSADAIAWLSERTAARRKGGSNI